MGAVAEVTCSVGPTGEREAWAGAGAHLKHVPHARDAGRVEAQRLVERIRVLPRVQREGIDERAAGRPGDGRALSAVA